ncbi:MAG TPA: hypothetical protein VF832_05530, partial [Longimicrobiales bacterium]
MRKSGRCTLAVLVALAVVTAAAGCGGGTDKLAVVQTEVASVGVSPASISVQVGQSTTLTAAAYAASGLSVAGA